MKRFKTFLSVALLAIFTFSLSSCNEDEELAYNIDGTWNGSITELSTGELYDATFYFEKTSSYSGWGRETDRGYITESNIEFDWTIRDKYIYINYDDGTEYIMEYQVLPSTGKIGERFTGYFVDSYNKDRVATFSLSKYSNDYADYAKKVQFFEEENDSVTK